MMETKIRQRVGTLLASAVLLAALSPHAGALAGLPDRMVLTPGDVAGMPVSLPLSAEVEDGQACVTASMNGEGLSLTAGEASGTAEVRLKLLGLVPVKTVTVTVEPERILIPGGRSLGVAVAADGVMVVGSSDLGRSASPARKAGIRPGDVIRTVNGQPVDGPESLSVASAAGETVQLGVLRDGEEMTFDVKPLSDPRDGAYRLGLWVRESTAGVGTLTYYDPESGEYGALGHAITDVDTGTAFPVGDGAVYENQIVQITRGAEGHPGELTGEFFEEEIALGEIERNTSFGVFGQGEDALSEDCLYPEGLPVGDRSEIHTGKAQILTTINGGGVKAYDCVIEKLYKQSSPETRSMVVRVTDEELLRATGGIVQGMSGSPIVQDGQIVGAVTHVFVSDPTRGYGVYIEWMLDAAA